MKTIQDMLVDLEEYYESAGFADIYEQKLKNLPEASVGELYQETFKDDRPDQEEWAAESR